eukprot:76656_1
MNSLTLFEYTAPAAASLQPCAHACLTSTGQYLIIAGGAGDLDTVQILNLITDEWIANVPTLQTARSRLSCNTVGEYLYVIAGKGNANSIFLSSVEMLSISDIENVNNAQWSFMNLSHGLAGHRSNVYDTKILILGGEIQNGIYHYPIIVINTDTNIITETGDLLSYAANQMATILVFPNIYAFAGWDGARLDTYQYHHILTANPTDDPTIQQQTQQQTQPSLTQLVNQQQIQLLTQPGLTQLVIQQQTQQQTQPSLTQLVNQQQIQLLTQPGLTQPQIQLLILQKILQHIQHYHQHIIQVFQQIIQLQQ